MKLHDYTYFKEPEVPPKSIWVLIGIDKESRGAREYGWFFKTREQARAYRKERGENFVRLIGPFKYNLEG